MQRDCIVLLSVAHWMGAGDMHGFFILDDRNYSSDNDELDSELTERFILQALAHRDNVTL